MKNKTLQYLIIVCYFLTSYSIYLPPIQGQISAVQASEIDQLFSKYNNSNSPGCIVGVIENGQFVYTKGYGMANIEKQIPFTPDTEFCIGSITKQFTAACIGLLVQDGKVDLEEDIRTYLPELSNYNQGIKVKHLLHHTSGIWDYTTLSSLKGTTYKRFTTYQETLPLLQRVSTLNFPPNTQHLYSNSGYLFLQEIVRRISGQSLQAFAKENIFGPLQMSNTFYNTDFERMSSKNTIGYQKDRAGNISAMVEQLGGVSNELIQTSLQDLLLWDQNFYHHRVGGEALNSMLQTKGILENGDTLNYAAGLVLGKYSGIPYVTHGGGNLGFGSEITRFPDLKKSIILFTNAPTINKSAMVFKIADIVLDKEIQKTPRKKTVPVPTIELSKTALKKYCAAYWNTKIDQPRYVYFKNGTIRYNRPDWYESPLVPIGNHTFRMLNSSNEQTTTTARFVLLENGKKELYISVGNGGESFAYAFERAKPKRKYLNRYNGIFFSKAIDFSFEVKFMNKKLYLITDEKMRYQLHPVKTDYFACLDGGVTFSRDETNNITGFTIDLTRVKGLYFNKN